MQQAKPTCLYPKSQDPKIKGKLKDQDKGKAPSSDSKDKGKASASDSMEVPKVKISFRGFRLETTPVGGPRLETTPVAEMDKGTLGVVENLWGHGAEDYELYYAMQESKRTAKERKKREKEIKEREKMGESSRASPPAPM